jgi:hypothetical protein
MTSGIWRQQKLSPFDVAAIRDGAERGADKDRPERAHGVGGRDQRIKDGDILLRFIPMEDATVALHMVLHRGQRYSGASCQLANVWRGVPRTPFLREIS